MMWKITKFHAMLALACLGGAVPVANALGLVEPVVYEYLF